MKRGPVGVFAYANIPKQLAGIDYAAGSLYIIAA
jgi:hypothetical protein